MILRTYLEELMDSKRSCTLRFKGSNEGMSTIKSRIIAIDETGERTIVRLENGFEMPVESIVEADGHYFEGTC